MRPSNPPTQTAWKSEHFLDHEQVVNMEYKTEEAAETGYRTAPSIGRRGGKPLAPKGSTTNSTSSDKEEWGVTGPTKIFAFLY